MSSAGPRDSTAFEVREALGLGGCPVCRLAVRSVDRWLASVLMQRPLGRDDLLGRLLARTISKSHGPRTVLDGVSVTVTPGSRIGVNGDHYYMVQGTILAVVSPLPVVYTIGARVG